LGEETTKKNNGRRRKEIRLQRKRNGGPVGRHISRSWAWQRRGLQRSLGGEKKKKERTGRSELLPRNNNKQSAGHQRDGFREVALRKQHDDSLTGEVSAMLTGKKKRGMKMGSHGFPGRTINILCEFLKGVPGVTTSIRTQILHVLWGEREASKGESLQFKSSKEVAEGKAEARELQIGQSEKTHIQFQPPKDVCMGNSVGGGPLYVGTVSILGGGQAVI